jgi:hypothetical protein
MVPVDLIVERLSQPNYAIVLLSLGMEWQLSHRFRQDKSDAELEGTLSA